MSTPPPDPQPAPPAKPAWRARLNEGWRYARARTASGYSAARAKLSTAPWKRIGLWTGGAAGALVATLILFLTFADWNAMKGPISSYASAVSGREIAIAGDLDVEPWSLTPRIIASGVSIGNPAPYRDRGRFAGIEHMQADVRLLPLIFGRLDIVRLDLENADIDLYRSAEGVSNWAPNAERGKPMNLPAIREFSVDGGALRLEDDKRRMVLEANFTSRQGDTEDEGFELSGEGALNRRPFSLEITGPALSRVRRDRPYAFSGRVRMGDTYVAADGAIRRPFDLSAFAADITARGGDLADLYYLIGLTLPNTPPYELAGRVERRGSRYDMTGLQGRVGDSDLEGAFSVTRPNDRPFLDGDFRSASLDFDDLMAVLGGAPSTRAGETVSPEQRAEAQRLAAQGRLLPDATLDISRVRNMDARVSYRAARVRSDTVPLRGLALDIALDTGLLTLDPAVLTLTQGRLSGAVSINAREATPQVDLDMRLADARVESFIPEVRGSHPLSGPLYGRIRITGRGAAVREAAANANGALSLVTPRGEVREAFAELTGINLLRGLGLLLSEDQDKIDVRCGVADFQVRNGVATAETFIFDTESMLIHGGGRISLRNETMDLRIEGSPKEPRLISLSAPITLRGPLRAPDIGVEAGGAAGQGGIAAALGALVAPLAGVLPFIDVGLAEDANCAALIREARPS